ncbi:MAG: hypothetical protein IJJ47_04710 [Methanosphaera sp.]|nr:hypothetical protein [Methanosphaera sp.]
MPSESFNEDQAYEVMDGVLDIEECEDPDAVADIINEEYINNPNNINYRNDYADKKEEGILDNKIIWCCLIIFIIFIFSLTF